MTSETSTTPTDPTPNQPIAATHLLAAPTSKEPNPDTCSPSTSAKSKLTPSDGHDTEAPPAQCPDTSAHSNIGPQFRICRIDVENGQIIWNDKLSFPVEPMLGVVGVAPLNAKPGTNSWAGQWGGNFDIQEVTTGAQTPPTRLSPRSTPPRRRHARPARRWRNLWWRWHRNRRFRHVEGRTFPQTRRNDVASHRERHPHHDHRHRETRRRRLPHSACPR